ncbi:Hypothetical protein D9617_12g035710 [Elsinoe fawcettii]|nr:Hypothetical protein D9617_12g035710 [Elsinoe fawcettii]
MSANNSRWSPLEKPVRNLRRTSSHLSDADEVAKKQKNIHGNWRRRSRENEQPNQRADSPPKTPTKSNGFSLSRTPDSWRSRTSSPDSTDSRTSSPSPPSRIVQPSTSRLSLRNSRSLGRRPFVGEVVGLPRQIPNSSIFRKHKLADFYGNPGNPEGHPLVVLEVLGKYAICAQCTSFTSPTFEEKDKSDAWAKMYYPLAHTNHRFYPELKADLVSGSMERETYINVSAPLAVEWEYCSKLSSATTTRLDVHSWANIRDEVIRFCSDRVSKSRRGGRLANYNENGCWVWVRSELPGAMRYLPHNYQAVYDDWPDHTAVPDELVVPRRPTTPRLPAPVPQFTGWPFPSPPLTPPSLTSSPESWAKVAGMTTPSPRLRSW